MSSIALFKALVRHELTIKGNVSKRNRASVAKMWWIVYGVILIVTGVSIGFYFAVHHTLQLSALWYVYLGFPYYLFFIGFGIFKMELENDTHCWWLTLPYPRKWLVAAKWIAAGLRISIILIGVYAVIALFSLAITICLKFYTWTDLGSMLHVGADWLILIIGLCPLIMSFGILTAISRITAIRPLAPVLWVVFMGGSGLSYSGIGSLFGEDGTGNPFNGVQTGSSFPHLWILLGFFLASWVVACLIVYLCSYLLDKKLAL